MPIQQKKDSLFSGGARTKRGSRAPSPAEARPLAKQGVKWISHPLCSRKQSWMQRTTLPIWLIQAEAAGQTAKLPALLLRPAPRELSATLAPQSGLGGLLSGDSDLLRRNTYRYWHLGALRGKGQPATLSCHHGAHQVDKPLPCIQNFQIGLQCSHPYGWRGPELSTPEEINLEKMRKCKKENCNSYPQRE